MKYFQSAPRSGHRDEKPMSLENPVICVFYQYQRKPILPSKRILSFNGFLRLDAASFIIVTNSNWKMICDWRSQRRISFNSFRGDRYSSGKIPRSLSPEWDDKAAAVDAQGRSSFTMQEDLLKEKSSYWKKWNWRKNDKMEDEWRA